MTDISKLNQRVALIEQDVEGERGVSRHILRKVTENETAIHALGERLTAVENQLVTLRADLPRIIADAVGASMKTSILIAAIIAATTTQARACVYYTVAGLEACERQDRLDSLQRRVEDMEREQADREREQQTKEALDRINKQTQRNQQIMQEWADQKRAREQIQSIRDWPNVEQQQSGKAQVKKCEDSGLCRWE